MKVFLVVSDLHVPFHDPRYIRIVNKLITKIKPNGLVQLGDALDFWQISKYEKDPARRETILEDILIYNQIILEWEDLLPSGAEFHQLEGNHSYRLTRYIASNAKEIHQIVKTLPELLNLNAKRRFKAKWYPLSDWDACRIGDCVLHHGHFFNQHTAVTNLIKYPTKLIQGHTHRFQYASNGDKFSVTLGHGSNEAITAHNPVPTGWQQALGILTLVGGETSFEAILVNDGKCIFRGEVISG